MNGPAFAEGLLAEADAAIGAGRTLPARWYTAPAVFDLELREIFGRTWTPFGIQHGLDEDGDYATDLVSGVPVLMTRSRGRVRAFLNACRHRGHPVAEGRGRADSFRCRYHGWTYDPNGALVDAPRAEREPEFDRSGLCLPEVGAAEWGPLKLVNPDPSAPAFDAARPSHDRQTLAADLRGSDVYDSVFTPPLAAGQLVLRQDGDRLLNAVHKLKNCRFQRALVADDTDNGALGSLAQVRLEPQLVDAVGDVLNFSKCCASFHDYDHSSTSWLCL